MGFSLEPLDALYKFRFILNLWGLNEGASGSFRLFPRILAGWEEAICDGETPAYLKGYLWLKLVTFWGVIRGEDSTYMDPAALKLNDRGLCGKLTQTKTTGPGKKVRIRNFEVLQ